MNKGQITAGIVMLVTAIVGLVILDGVVQPTWDTATVINEDPADGSTVTNGTTYTLDGTNGWKCIPSGTSFTAYDNTNSTVIPSSAYTYTTYPTPAAWTLTNASYGGTNVTLNYTVVSCSMYMSSSILRTIMQNITVIAAVVALGLAGLWLYTRTK